MRISDWSSDVFSSDLETVEVVEVPAAPDVAILAQQGQPGTQRCEPSRQRLVGRTNPCRHVDDEPQFLAQFLQDRQKTGGGNRASVMLQHRDIVDQRRPHAVVQIMGKPHPRSEEHTSELQSLMRISYAVFCLKKKK